MKKIISLKTQRIISFIPLANAFVLSVWLRNYRSAVNDSKVFAKSLLVLFATTIPLGVVYMLLSRWFAAQNVVRTVLTCAAIYGIPLSMAQGLIWFQKRVFDE